MNSTQYRKELLYRKANGKLIIGSYLSKINSLISLEEKELSFVSLELTDDILEKSSRYEIYSVRKKILLSELSLVLESIKKYNSCFYVFIDDDWKYCGAFIIPSLKVLKKDFIFGDKIVNDIIFISNDFTKTISFDYYEMDRMYYIDVTESTT